MAFFLRHRCSEIKRSWIIFKSVTTLWSTTAKSIGIFTHFPCFSYTHSIQNFVKRCLAISPHFGQQYTVLTVDQALICKLMELKWSHWSVKEYHHKLIVRLGGLHTAMNFLRVIWDPMTGSRLDELHVWLDSGLLGEGALQLVLSGKGYNKAMRAHRLTL